MSPKAKDKEQHRTALNAFSLALTTLSAVSSQIPLATPLGGIIDSLLALAGRIEQTSANAAGFAQLAARIEWLTPVVKDLAQNEPGRGRVIVGRLESALRSMKEDFEAAKGEGRLARFLNSDDNKGVIEKHNAMLAQLIADSTLATMAEVLKRLRESESQYRSKSPVEAEETFVMGDLAGGCGGSGGNATGIGGDGGPGDGPQLVVDADLDVDRIRVGNVSGGTGGAGGTGVDRGGVGGVGRGPIISLRRNRFVSAVGPSQA
ncbi:hypothetical protein R3P38DRAFT_3177257 [Favolaschia claudopus]|uniref:NACHT-NTPase and P-loop NTPases N-terminal domain-containing protein n=1 Tax=Favolaschia claudopus TaxID=2862362 RepID=A0AAW0D289_9AGAR